MAQIHERDGPEGPNLEEGPRERGEDLLQPEAETRSKMAQGKSRIHLLGMKVTGHGI